MAAAGQRRRAARVGRAVLRRGRGHAEGDEEAEHRYTAQLLAHARAEGGDGLWLDVVRFISGTGHAGEAIELAEPYLRDHPGDKGAAFTYSVMLREAAGLPAPGDRERAALERFADRLELAEVKRAVMTFMDRTEWGDLVKSKAASALDLVPGRRLTAPALEVCAKLALEAAVKGTESGIEGKTPSSSSSFTRAGTAADRAHRVRGGPGHSCSARPARGRLGRARPLRAVAADLPVAGAGRAVP